MNSKLSALTGCVGMLLGLMVVFTPRKESADLNEGLFPVGEKLRPVSANSSTCSAFKAWAPSRVVPAVVLQVISDRYIDVQRNFVYLMERNSEFTRDNLYLVCLGHESSEVLLGHGIRCVPVTDADGYVKRDIWRLRLRVLRCLLGAGHDVIMSDSDALWLHDPLEYLRSTEETPTKIVGSQVDRSGSIVSSRGRFPRDLARRWGSTMCMGFVLFRAAGDSMVSFQTAMERIVTETGDDQVAINVAAKELGVVWDPGSDMRFEASTGFGRGVIPGVGGGDIVVTLLPHGMFTRICDSTPISSETVVAHCRSKKRAAAKRSWMKTANLWFVDTGKNGSENTGWGDQATRAASRPNHEPPSTGVLA